MGFSLTNRPLWGSPFMATPSDLDAEALGLQLQILQHLARCRAMWHLGKKPCFVFQILGIPSSFID